uniref:transposase n=1 Tax=Candidatus Enterovibrio escicola TaxID=1927127 RepID=UPI0021DF72CC|nr:transposase [Candidatus Enterovibrio escacola]
MWCLYGDKGYISNPLERELADKGVTLITGMKKNMQPKVMELCDRLMLRKRFIIEPVFNQLKTYPKSSILGTVVVSALWSTFWWGSSYIYLNQRSRVSR